MEPSTEEALADGREALQEAQEGREHQGGTKNLSGGCHRQAMTQRNALPVASRPPASVDCHQQAAAVERHPFCSTLEAASMRSGRVVTDHIARDMAEAAAEENRGKVPVTPLAQAAVSAQDSSGRCQVGK